MKITVDIEELKPGLTNSFAVAEYLRALLRINALRRALGEALVAAERRKQRLTPMQLNEAFTLRELIGGHGHPRRSEHRHETDAPRDEDSWA